MTSQILVRITTQYNETEDRIRISGEVLGHRTVVLWMSQRLARRLVLPLIRWLEKEKAHLPMSELHQEMTQQAAEAGLRAESPVEAASDVAGYLVTNIDLSFTNDAAWITFKWPGGPPVILPISKTALRQWLGILRKSFERAEWPLDIWPVWTRAEERALPSIGPAILH